ncbi:YbaK/EbsC family protein [Clostridium oryzae]|uniref:Cys-tRNA(Pro)/Cys-tRNA(Cys) deacylase YbaK n=1 Tax=Clostridium oryzae TaxID=1450648 RepID=A0A1V4ICZ4_9CLOT|nr:YbaK/EbsC family protein [Clostridium oryzae]OPJ57872.1 Cys-tRNA(Pro)/Cys-tRNA(Cys) deacylase YbaK [Clostridium oryzae]
MSVEAVKNFFNANNFHADLIQLDECSATVDLAAEALGVRPELIAKSLAFKLKDRNIIVVTCGNARIDNKKYKTLFSTKAKMLTSEEVLEYTGHPVGGVCPFGVKTDIQIYLDESLREFEYVYPAAGSTHTAVKISVDDLEKLTEGIWVNICQ